MKRNGVKEDTDTRESNNSVYRRDRDMARTLLIMVGILIGMLDIYAQQTVSWLQGQDDKSLNYNHFFLEAMIQRQKGNNDAAFDLLQHCIKINPKAPEAYYYLAQYYQLMKNDSLATANFEQALELEPTNIIFLETMAQTRVSQQDFANAIPLVERIYQQDMSREEL